MNNNQLRAVNKARDRIHLDALSLVCAWRCLMADGHEHSVPLHIRVRLAQLDESYAQYEKAREEFLVRPMGVER